MTNVDQICTMCDGAGVRVRKAADIHPAMNVYGWTRSMLHGVECYVQHCKACGGSGLRPTGTSGVPAVSPPSASASK
jgi:DnaJ-class molecular chaperone